MLTQTPHPTPPGGPDCPNTHVAKCSRCDVQEGFWRQAAVVGICRGHPTHLMRLRLCLLLRLLVLGLCCLCLAATCHLPAWAAAHSVLLLSSSRWGALCRSHCKSHTVADEDASTIEREGGALLQGGRAAVSYRDTADESDRQWRSNIKVQTTVAWLDAHPTAPGPGQVNPADLAQEGG